MLNSIKYSNDYWPENVNKNFCKQGYKATGHLSIYTFIHSSRYQFFNPFMSSGHFYLNSLDLLVQYKDSQIIFYFFLCPNANNADPDQMPQNGASDLVLHCLPMSFLGTLGINGLPND